MFNRLFALFSAPIVAEWEKQNNARGQISPAIHPGKIPVLGHAVPKILLFDEGVIFPHLLPLLRFARLAHPYADEFIPPAYHHIAVLQRSLGIYHKFSAASFPSATQRYLAHTAVIQIQRIAVDGAFVMDQKGVIVPYILKPQYLFRGLRVPQNGLPVYSARGSNILKLLWPFR